MLLNTTSGCDLIVVGCQFGDEGKGRFTDVFAQGAFAVVRYQGGPHTGHTVITEGGKFRFVQVPSGVLRGVMGVLGNGCVIEPGGLLDEMAVLESKGMPVKLRISESAHVVFPYHMAQDEAMERWRGGSVATSQAGVAEGLGQIGSTRRGVGPCREDKIARIGLRLTDLLEPEVLRARLCRLLPMKRLFIEKTLGSNLEELATFRKDAWDLDNLVAKYHSYGCRLAPFMCDVSVLLSTARQEGRFLVYEGAQSIGLDIEYGTYPYCSSGYSAAGGVTIGTGSSPAIPFQIYGVAKAYTSRVGGGPLPTELDGPIADQIVERGFEYGTVTGRRRRVGWLDLVLLRHAVQVDGISHLCLGAIDVLAGLSEVKVATSYLINGSKSDRWPEKVSDWAKVQPVYATLPGWPDQDWQEVARQGLPALSANARRYVEFVVEALGIELAAIAVGPSREATIVLHIPPLPKLHDHQMV
ncbi:MAG TPA: adenylosuccinate synthase [Candidatus Angelobacter sp.]|jgi:adenylosuccinate synthase|nr:adenylosuccinate synthase [Candidatus Angelobacter sp.]